jgi:hypothetical protein
MEDDREDDLPRAHPRSPYRPVDLTLQLPLEALNATLGLLQRATRCESGVLWYGERDPDGDGTVAYVVAPRQRMSWGNYHIPPDALAEVVHRLPEHWKPLAQVHSHPGIGVEHSRYDDRMASSRRALSLVFPFHGHLRAAFPTGVGVHEWQDDYWHLLDLKQAKRRVILGPGAVRVDDLR